MGGHAHGCASRVPYITRVKRGCRPSVCIDWLRSTSFCGERWHGSVCRRLRPTAVGRLEAAGVRDLACSSRRISIEMDSKTRKRGSYRKVGAASDSARAGDCRPIESPRAAALSGDAGWGVPGSAGATRAMDRRVHSISASCAALFCRSSRVRSAWALVGLSPSLCSSSSPIRRSRAAVMAEARKARREVRRSTTAISCSSSDPRRAFKCGLNWPRSATADDESSCTATSAKSALASSPASCRRAKPSSARVELGTTSQLAADRALRMSCSVCAASCARRRSSLLSISDSRWRAFSSLEPERDDPGLPSSALCTHSETSSCCSVRSCGVRTCSHAAAYPLTSTSSRCNSSSATCVRAYGWFSTSSTSLSSRAGSGRQEASQRITCTTSESSPSCSSGCVASASNSPAATRSSGPDPFWPLGEERESAIGACSSRSEQLESLGRRGRASHRAVTRCGNRRPLIRCCDGVDSGSGDCWRRAGAG
eukprot:scaffold4107_cov95-Isochrysis_galbana.AAC.6